MKIKRVVNKRFAKGKGEYENVINDIEQKGKCPFCPDNFKYHKKPILKKIGTWFVTENSWPYKNTKYHFIIINTIHKEHWGELTTKDFKSIQDLVNWTIKNFKIKGGAFAMRFGDTDFTGATVSHIHAHIIYPKTDKSKKSITVNFPIG